jgi:RNA polymerase sigma factor (sigma-70 family)
VSEGIAGRRYAFCVAHQENSEYDGIQRLGWRLFFVNHWWTTHTAMSTPGPEFLGRMLDEYAAALTLFARQWCNSPDDVVQEAFLQLARQTECPRDAAAWLYRVVRNGAISAGRAQSRRQRHEAAAAAEISRWFAGSSIESAIDAQAAAEALVQLPAEEREVIVAHIWGGLSFTQIAELTNSSSSTVHRRYQAGLVALRKLLGEPCLTNNPRAKSSRQN